MLLCRVEAAQRCLQLDKPEQWISVPSACAAVDADAPLHTSVYRSPRKIDGAQNVH